MSNIFEDIKHKIKLLEYVSKFVKMKDVGHRHLGLCPFHYEKTPSFYVDDATNLFYCFGCNKGGDLFSFYCLFHNCEKQEALKQLAKQAGVVRTFIVKNDLNILLEFFVMQTDHFEFLKKRGINAESISKFKLGWAPSFFVIMNFINKNHLRLADLGFKESFLKGFQNRIVFPIFNEIGVLVSFSGRILNDGAYKYINGAESAIFHKNEILYGLNFIEKKEEIFLVEGYIDVIMMAQFSYSAVASMGTAISSDQIKMLWKYTNKIVVIMDGDVAGQKAAEKIALLALELICTGKEISFIVLDEKYDPASYLNDNLKVEHLKKYALYEYLVYLKGDIPSNLDKRAIYFKELNEHVELIKDFNLKIEYKKFWNSLRWKKNVNVVSDKLKIIGEDYLILLLFKYVVCYNGLLDHVAEDFLKLNMNEMYKLSLINILNNMSLDDNFLKKLNQVNIEITNMDLEEIMKEWYSLYYRIQKPSEDMKKVLLDDFSEEAWENYKKLLEKKDQNYNDY